MPRQRSYTANKPHLLSTTSIASKIHEKTATRSPKISCKRASITPFIFSTPYFSVAYKTGENTPTRSPKIICKPLSIAPFIFSLPYFPITNKIYKKTTTRSPKTVCEPPPIAILYFRKKHYATSSSSLGECRAGHLYIQFSSSQMNKKII